MRSRKPVYHPVGGHRFTTYIYVCYRCWSPAALRKLLITFLLMVFVPIGISAARYYFVGDGRGNWQTADRSSAGLLPALAPGSMRAVPWVVK
jgi:hypothetical protein